MCKNYNKLPDPLTKHLRFKIDITLRYFEVLEPLSHRIDSCLPFVLIIMLWSPMHAYVHRYLLLSYRYWSVLDKGHELAVFFLTRNISLWRRASAPNVKPLLWEFRQNANLLTLSTRICTLPTQHTNMCRKQKKIRVFQGMGFKCTTLTHVLTI